MDTLPGTKCLELEADARLVAAAVRRGVTSKRATAGSTAWRLWRAFCDEYQLDYTLSTYRDPVPYLQIFGQRVRDGRSASKGAPVMARTAEDAVRQVAQTLASMGSPDPRLDTHGKVDFRITRQIAGWKRDDPASKRKRPVPKQVLDSLTTAAWCRPEQRPQKTAVDLMWIGVYFLLRPSEYLRTTHAEQHPFLINDIAF